MLISQQKLEGSPVRSGPVPNDFNVFRFIGKKKNGRAEGFEKEKKSHGGGSENSNIYAFQKSIYYPLCIYGYSWLTVKSTGKNQQKRVISFYQNQLQNAQSPHSL